MQRRSAEAAAPHPPTWVIVVSGIVALAAAMGIGRFAFTPLLPLMLRDGTLNAAAGAEWAAANYAGYLAGALTASIFAGHPQLGVRLSLVGIALSTMAPAWIDRDSMELVGAVLRAVSGVCSAWALVCASSWCLTELARRHRPQLGAWIYCGVGLGIALAGTIAWLGGQQTASALWLELGTITAAGTIIVAAGLGRRTSAPPPAVTPAHAQIVTKSADRQWDIVACYGVFGFGYIIPATFLPAMARELTADPLVFGITWPLFGLAAALSVALAAHRLHGWPRRRVWALAQGTMAVGTALPLISHALWSLAASAVLVGGTFMVATMAGLQLARELSPANPTPLLARMTVAFAVGQIIGPVVIRLLGTGTWAGWDSMAWASAASTLLLAISTAWFCRDGGPLAGSEPTQGA
ncbi:MAG: YbfB/YjiJ family MFS transporter [Pseudomonadota bacterium]